MQGYGYGGDVEDINPHGDEGLSQVVEVEQFDAAHTDHGGHDIIQDPVLEEDRKSSQDDSAAKRGYIAPTQPFVGLYP